MRSATSRLWRSWRSQLVGTVPSVTSNSSTSRSRACSAATWTSASVKRAPARRSEGATDTGGDGGLFTGDILLSPALASSDRGGVLVLVRALPLEPHHSDHRGRRQP